MLSLEAKRLKELGNKHFSNSQFEDAISCYTKALVASPKAAVLYSNRAMGHFRLGNLDASMSDCIDAIALDNSIVKAHYYCAQILLKRNLFDDALASLLKAHELSKEKPLNYGDSITSEIRSLKKKRFLKQEEIRTSQEIELQDYLVSLMEKDQEKKLQEFSETDSDGADKAIQLLTEERKKLLDDMFKEIAGRRKNRQVPDSLCGKISFVLMRDPVITPSGVTYDRKDIEEHLQRVGHFDPTTRLTLHKDMLIPNLSMKEVINNFLEENPWAEEGF